MTLQPVRVRNEMVLVGTALFVVLLVFFAPALRPGYMLSPADLIFESPFYAAYAPSDFERASNGLLFDQVYQFIPWRHFAWSEMRAGEIPLWNPYSQMGKPFVATMQTAVFYPINVLMLAIPFESGFVWSAILRLWIAGMATYFLVRSYAIREVPAFVSAPSFMLSGFMIVWLGHPHTNVAALLPAALLFTELVLRLGERRHLLLAFGSFSLVVGCQFLGGHPETSLNLLVALAVYALARAFLIGPGVLLSFRCHARRLVMVAFGVVLGAVVAGVQLVLFLEWIQTSNELVSRSARQFVWLNPDLSKHILTLPLLFFPNAYGNPTWDYPYWSFLLNWSNYNEQIWYVGVVPAVFAVVGLVFGWTRYWRVLSAWSVLGLFALSRALHIPGPDWFSQLPGIGLGSPDRLRLVVALTLSVISGFGLHVFLYDPDRRWQARKWALRIAGVIAASGSLLFVGSNAVLPRIRGRIIEHARALVDVEYAARATHTHELDYYYDEVDAMVDGLVTSFRPGNIEMYASSMIAAVLVLLLLWCRRQDDRGGGRWRRNIVSAGLIGLVVGDLVVFGQAYNPSLRRSEFFPQTPLTVRLKGDDLESRTVTLRQDMVPDAGMMMPLADVRGLDYPTIWYAEYMRLNPEALPWLSYGTLVARADSPLIRVLAVRYVVSAREDELQEQLGLVDAEPIGDVYVARVAEPQPRGFLVFAVDVVPSDEDVKNKLTLEPRRVFERALVTQSEWSAAGLDEEDVPSESGIGAVVAAGDGDDKYAWNVRSNRAAMLVMSDSYFPGWSATVNGVEAPILRVNHAFRGVIVPAGESAVALRYAPASFRLGVALSLVGLACVLVLAAWGFLLHRSTAT